MDRGGMDQGADRREKAMSMAMRRKEEYLGARVPKELRDRVIQKAKEQGVPVSILIRNILEDAFNSEVESMVASDDLNKVAFDDVLGWEVITLNKSVNCASCGVQLGASEKAVLGLGLSKPLVICGGCKDKL